jgi:glycosyltransferase involved in cell wall biosynthesis
MESKQGQLISVIIPVCNTAPFLSNCLDSVLCQSYDNFELIAVDDGSSDGSGEILEAYAARDPRIRIYKQSNRGAGAARNAGTEASRGDWVCFVDSDDHLSPRYLERLLTAGVEKCADLIMCGGIRYDSETGFPLEDRSLNLGNFPLHLDQIAFSSSQVEDRREFLMTNLGPWGKLLSSELARSLPFPETVRRFEDNPFVYGALLGAKRITYIREQLYYYRQHRHSTMGKVVAGEQGAEVLRDFLEIRKLCKDVLAEEPSMISHYEEATRPIALHYYSLLDKEQRNHVAPLMSEAGIECPEEGETASRRTIGRRILRFCALFAPHGLVRLAHFALDRLREQADWA